MPGPIRSTYALRFNGPQLDPEKLTRLLGFLPTTSARAGEVIRSVDGEARLVTEGLWLLDYGEPDTVDLEMKIDTLLNNLNGNPEVWKRLARTARAELVCGLLVDSLNADMALSAEVQRKLADRRVQIRFGIYSLPEIKLLPTEPPAPPETSPAPPPVTLPVVLAVYGEALMLAQSMETGMNIFYHLDQVLPKMQAGKVPRIDFDSAPLAETSFTSLGGFLRRFRRELLEEGDVDAVTRGIMRSLEKSAADRNWLVHTFWWENTPRVTSEEGRAGLQQELQAMVAQFRDHDALIRRMVLLYLERYELKAEQFPSARLQAYLGKS